MKRIIDILKEESFKKYCLCAGFVLVLICILELTVFNFRFYQTMGDEVVVPEYGVSANLELNSKGYYCVTDDSTVPYVEMNGLDVDVNTVYMELTFPSEGVYAVKPVTIHYEVKDDGTSVYYPFATQEFLRLVPQTHFTYPEVFGNLHDLKLCFDSLRTGDQIRIEGIRINEPVPMRFAKKRVLALWLTVMFLFMFRPSSFLHRFEVFSCKKLFAIAVISLVVIEAALSFVIVNMNSYYRNPNGYSGEHQYHLLAQAFAEGKPYLLEEPPESLKAMEDPYDYELRVQETDDEAFFDVAYYEGRYYVYFGVGPVVMFYLPYYLITGAEMPGNIVVYLYSLLVITAVPFLLSELVKRWFAKCKLAIFLMFDVLFTFGCGTIFYLVSPSHYCIPIVGGLGLALWGVALWLKYAREGKAWALALGSLCMALTAAFRPTFLLLSFVAIPLFWKRVFRDRTLFSKKSIFATIGLILPYVLVAVPLMYYNYIRFGSVTDFGAFYNLTTDNLPLRRMKLSWVLYGTIGWLFYPCNVNNIFPYFHSVDYSSKFQALAEFENIYGGIIYNNLILIPAFLFWKFKNVIREKSLYVYTVLVPFICLALMLFDNRNGGVNTRYCGDFALYLFTSSFIILCACFERLEERLKNAADTSAILLYGAVDKGFYVIFIYTIVRLFLTVFGADIDANLNATLPFYTVKHMIEFWH